MALQFTPPPEDLLRAYIERKQPAEIASESIGNAIATYAQDKASQKEKEQKRQDEATKSYIDAYKEGGPDLAAEVAKRYGLKNPPKLPGETYFKTDPAGTAGMVNPPTTPQPIPNTLPTPNEQGMTQSLPQDHPLANDPIVAAHIQQTGLNPMGYKMPTQDEFNKFSTMGDYGKKKQDEALSAAKFGEALQTAQDKTKPIPVLTKDAALEAGSIDPRAKILEPKDTSAQDNKYTSEQDRLEQQAIDRVSKLRGDASLARVETQRDAAIQAYNTIDRIQKEGRAPTKLEYYDILGQMWKARTGASPTDQALKDLDQQTLKGNLGNAYTYFSGKTAGATTQDILNNVKSFAVDSGQQADKFHASYMQSHRIKPSGLEDRRWQPIFNTARGLGFAEGTGYQPDNNSLPSIGGTFQGGKVLSVKRID